MVAVFESSLGKVHGVLPKRHTRVLGAFSSGPKGKELFFGDCGGKGATHHSGKGPFMEGSFPSFAKVVRTVEPKSAMVKTVTERLLGLLDKKKPAADGSFGQKS
jgi:hypothetical protein